MDTPNSPQPLIRQATSADLPALLELIRELAQFEHLEHELETTVESLNEAFFGREAVASTLLASLDGHTVGYAIYFFTFSSFLGRRGLWLDECVCKP
jgi:hypothetical protein